MSQLEYNLMRARVEFIANTLLLADDEIPDIDDDEGVVKFCQKFGQSLDWVFLGDTRCMIARLAKLDGQPPMIAGI